ncbi:MAG: winged helix-turn-helix transcriptional regulator [Anaerolineae bacterium]|nr:winged helix-turn-helix transcriptional regulator [Anaerolineae bacterium]
MISTKERVLRTLLNKPKTSINDLATAVGINPISVRHHVTNLQAEGLVDAQEELHGVGRPRLIYSLTELGMEKFPTRYLRLTTRLLDQMKSSLPPPTVTKLFADMATNMAEDYSEQVQGLNIEERLDLVSELLTKEGFTVEWEKVGDQYRIHEKTCPYLQIGQNHPEVCTVDQTLISQMLALPAEKVQCILDGSSHCTYVVQPTEVAKI